MAEYRIARLEVLQPVFGTDPQLYTYNAYLADTSTGDPAFVQATTEYPETFEWGALCAELNDLLSPDTLDETCP